MNAARKLFDIDRRRVRCMIFAVIEVKSTKLSNQHLR